VKHLQEAPVATPRKSATANRRPAARLSSQSSAIIELGGPADGGTIDVFTANGEVYGMPVDVSAELALEGLERMAVNEAAAIVWLLQEVFGKDGYAALKRTATAAQLRAVSDVVADHVLGAAEGN
jgi:hypothetical protein